MTIILKWVSMILDYISVPIGLYGFQHYLSMLGSLILIPLVIVPAMGGSHVSGLLFPQLYKILIFLAMSC